jgi:GTPase SAR1 family protein
LRRISYYGGDIFLFCFDITNPETLKQIETKYIPEVVNCGDPNCELKAIYLLIGTKSDLRSNSMHCVTVKQAEEVAKRNRCLFYHETSSLHDRNSILELGQLLVQTAIVKKCLDVRKEKKKKTTTCCIC